MRCMHGLIALCFILLAGCGNLSQPMDFSFTTQYGVAQNATITSNTVTMLGNQFAADISIVNGEYSISGGAYTSAPGRIGLNQTLTVRHTSASTTSTATTTTVTVGGFTTTFTSVTNATLSFASQTDVEFSTLIVSNTITLPGTQTSSAISISGGEYSIDGGAYTSATGTIGANQTLTVRHTSAATKLTATVTTVTIGSTTLTFTSTTKDIPTDPTGTIQILSFGPNAPFTDVQNTSFNVAATTQNTGATDATFVVIWVAKSSSGEVLTTGTYTDTVPAGSTLEQIFKGGSLATTTYNNIKTWSISSITKQ